VDDISAAAIFSTLSGKDGSGGIVVGYTHNLSIIIIIITTTIIIIIIIEYRDHTGVIK